MRKTDQLVWVIYDISSDKARTKTAKAMEAAGLYRVQKSVFLGTIEKNRLDELELRIEKLISKKKDSVYLFPLCEQDFKKVRVKGVGFDEKLVSDEIRSLFV